MDDPIYTSNQPTAYLLLIICMIFVSVDGLELYRLFDQWDHVKHSFNPKTFEQCIKYPLLAKTGFTFFSFLAAFSAFLIALLLTINLQYFVEKISRAYVYMVYLIFGPYMLIMGLIGVYYWEKILYSCENDQPARIFSFSNLFNLVACVSIALIITLGMLVYECIVAYMNSIQQRFGGSPVLRKCFWWIIIRYRNPNGNRLLMMTH
jgi:hypothetical protein